jgi:hypothetical protein
VPAIGVGWGYAEPGELAYLVVLIAAICGLVLRYRRGDELRRRQLLWLVLALLLMFVVVVPWGLFTACPILELLWIAPVPAAMTIAVLRHQLLDIRLVLSRTVVYALLTIAVVGRTSGSSAPRTWCCDGLVAAAGVGVDLTEGAPRRVPGCRRTLEFD